jgi:hypothetical protein
MRNAVFLLVVSFAIGAVPIAQNTGPVDYALGRDSQAQAGVPTGTVTQHKLAPGRFYPGTTHNYQLYVPAQYDPKRPAPFMIFLDGNGYAGDAIRVPVVFDNLIARGELPPMIGIFVNPGVLPALSEQSQNRYERIFQYDSQTPRFANFLVDELIPEVAKSYNLSKDPNDRGIAGTSTGGVGAFVAAWERPDQFRRVLTLIGSFGNFRGADRLPGLIRKTEPKPIRVIMQTGRQDINNYAGSWCLENPRMAAALEFARCDVKLGLAKKPAIRATAARSCPTCCGGSGVTIRSRSSSGAGARGRPRHICRARTEEELVPAPATAPERASACRGTSPAAGSARRNSRAHLVRKRLGRDRRGYKSVARPRRRSGRQCVLCRSRASRIYKSDAARNVVVFKDGASGARALRVGQTAVCMRRSRRAAGSFRIRARRATRKSLRATSSRTILRSTQR